MIAAVVFSLLTAGVPPAVAAVQDDPPIRITLNNDRRYRRGDRAKVQVRVDDDGYLLVLHADPDGRVRVLFPLDPSDDNFVRGGRSYEIRGRGDREAFAVDVSSGSGAVYAAVSRDPFRFDGFVTGDHWDARAISDEPLQRDPEPELNELVRRMSTGRFEYDLVAYDVSERAATVVYAPTVVRSSYYDPFCDRYTLYTWDCDPYYYNGGSRVSIHIGFGRPYYGYRPGYYYDPYYSPYDRDIYRYGSYYGYYDPYYYRPIYRYPAPYYNRPGYSYPGRRYAGATPFDIKQRDRRWDGLTAPDRRVVGTQATHTIYGEPPSRRAVTQGAPGGEPKLNPVPAERDRDDARRGRRTTDDARVRPSIDTRRTERAEPERRSRGIVTVPDAKSPDIEREKAPERRSADPERREPKREVQREPQLERRKAEPERRESQPERREAQPERRAEPPRREAQPERREAPRSMPQHGGGGGGGGGRRRT